MFDEFGRHEAAFDQWVKGGFPGAKAETIDYLRHLSDPGENALPREGTLWRHQWDSLLRVIYAYEIEREALARPNGLLLNVVTGGGKTAIIAAAMAWLRIAHGVRKFVLLCPNLIVRDRLEEDFEGGKVFEDRDLLPAGKNAAVTKNDFALSTLGIDRPRGWANMLGSNVILGNIHQFYASNASGQANLAELMNGPDFVIFNDEAHNSPAPEWDETLDKMRRKTLLRIDTTATPDRADGKSPDSKMIYEYLIGDALAPSERLVKSPVVYRPNIAAVELTYTDARTGEKRGVEEINWAEVDRLGMSATQWVTDDKPMQQQMGIALRRLEEQERRAKGRYQPILFVVAVSKLDAEKAAKTLERRFGIKTLLVTEDSSDEERRKATQIRAARRGGEPYKAVVSVLMLREGWDVPEVGVILLLRKFSSKVYGQQVIGRGLRRVRQKDVLADEQQICAAVDHPKLEHGWLWSIFGSKIRENVGLDDQFDELEDLPEPPPRQELTQPENIVVVPEPSGELEGEFEIKAAAQAAAPLQNWREVLEGLAYPTQTVEITGQTITDIESRELTEGGWTMRESHAPYEAMSHVEVEAEKLADGVQEELLAIADRLLIEAGHSSQFKGRIYDILLQHVRTKFLDGASLRLARQHHLEAARRTLPAVEEKILGVPGLVEGMVKYGDQ